jgi:hypothetical protein
LLISISINVNAAIRHANKSVGAPLDGGVLTILAASGIGYYIIRKNKKPHEKI